MAYDNRTYRFAKLNGLSHAPAGCRRPFVPFWAFWCRPVELARLVLLSRHFRRQVAACTERNELYDWSRCWTAFVTTTNSPKPLAKENHSDRPWLIDSAFHCCAHEFEQGKENPAVQPVAWQQVWQILG